MHVLLVEPRYPRELPPVGLLKLSSYHKLQGDTTELARGPQLIFKKPDLIYITSLWTWEWRSVWESVRYYKALFPDVELWLGGIYASLNPDHAKKSGADRIWIGLFPDAEDLMPDYSLVPKWDASIVYSSRGCNRKCPFCAVWRLEGKISYCRDSIKKFIYPPHPKIIVLDNNIGFNPHWRNILRELAETGKWVDFNAGLDARLFTEEFVDLLCKIRLGPVVKARIGYDMPAQAAPVRKAIAMLTNRGIRGRDIMTYNLYNFTDTPDEFFIRVKNTVLWGATSFPMRYVPLDALDRKFVSKTWTKKELKMVQKTLSRYGTGGAFPPTSMMKRMIRKARCFHDFFRL